MECIKDRYLDNLNKEVMVLKDENHMLRMKLEDKERRLNADRSIERSLDHENNLLKHDLSKVEMISRSMKMEKDHVIMDTELELIKLQKRLKQLEIDYESLEQEKLSLSDQLSESLQMSSTLDGELNDYKDIVARVQEDKLRLSQRIEKLTANERALVLECERFKRREKGSKSRDSVNQVEQYMRDIENERDYWKNEVELLREIQRKATRSPVHTQSSLTKNVTANKSPKKVHSKDKQKIRELEKEKDELKIQLESLRPEKGASPALRNRSPSPGLRSRSPTKDIHKTSDDIVQIKRERDDLRNLLNKLERKVSEIQDNVKMLTNEKDRFCQLYEDSQMELRNMRQDLLCTQEDGGRATSQIKKLLNRVEMEKDGLQAELARVQSDRDSMHERYKVTVEKANQEKYLLERKLDDLQNSIIGTRYEKREMTERIDSLRSRILELEEALKNLEIGSRENLSKLETEKEGTSQLKQHIQKLEKHLESTERQASHLSCQLAKSDERGFLQDQKITALTEEMRVQRGDLTHIRCTANRLDEDKNQLKSTLNEASERLKQLENDLVSAEDELQDTRANLTMTEKQLGKVTEALTSRENENRHIRKKTDHAIGQVDEFQRKLTILTKENDRLSETTSELQRANKKLKKDLGETIDEREELRVEVQNYIEEVKRAENILSEHERDQTDLLKQYQILSADAESFRQKFEMCQRDLIMGKQEILERENDLERLQNRLAELEKENIDLKFSNRDLEARISHLGLLVGQNREQANMIQHERDGLMLDLSSLRDLCGRLEKSKEDLQKELDSKNLDLEQMQANLDDVEHENETLKEEFENAKDNLRTIQGYLNASKGEEQNCLTEIQEKNTELNTVNSNLQMAEERIQQIERELQRLKFRNTELERESERLQRSVTSEKFEKDRALSELRLHSLSPAYKPSCYLSNSPHRSCSPCRGSCSPSYN